MRKYVLLTAAATSALVCGAPALAQIGGSVNGTGTITYNNNVDTRLTTTATYNKNVTLTGTATLDGNIYVDSSAVAVVDSKQILTGNRVTFREEHSTDGQSGNVDPAVWGAGDAVVCPGTPSGDCDGNDIGDTTIDIGFFSPVINNVAGATVTGAGNLGLNMAAGYYNMQSNVASIANSSFDGSTTDTTDSAGWSEASATVLQLALGNFYGPDETQTGSDSGDTAGNDYRDRNTVGAFTVNGTGNIGVNAAAGAYNVQQNTLAMATSTDAALAEANAAVIQSADVNRTVVMDTVNTLQGGTFGGAGSSGNIGVNLAAGVGNMQANTLVIASSFGTGADTGGGGGGGGGGGTGQE